MLFPGLFGMCFLTVYAFFLLFHIYRIAITVLMASVGILGPLYDKWAHRSFRKWRTLIYVISGFASASPVVHFLLLYGWPKEFQLMDYASWFMMAALYLGGAAIYAYRVPERYVFNFASN